MNEKVIKDSLLNFLEDRMNMFGISQTELDADFDLVKSGLLDSMAFVDMIGALEEQLGVEIDFDKVMEDERFTTFSGVIDLFNQELHG